MTGGADTFDKWVAIRLLDYFEPMKGNQNRMDSLSPGMTPLVSAKNVDNGYKGFVSVDRGTYKGHCLTINNDGDGGAGIAYYQPSDMALDSHVTALVPKMEMSSDTLLFIATCITKQRYRFGHGYSLNSGRLGQMKIVLPANQDSIPDFIAMDNYIKAMRGGGY